MIHLSWSVKRESGRPLLPTDIDRYEITVKLNGNELPATPPPPSATTYDFAETDFGIYTFALVCVPKKGAKSAPATGSVEVLDESQVVIFDFTVEVIAP